MHNGTLIMELIDTVTELFRAHAHEFEVCRGCKGFVFECDCPAPDPREELYERPERER